MSGWEIVLRLGIAFLLMQPVIRWASRLSRKWTKCDG